MSATPDDARAETDRDLRVVQALALAAVGAIETATHFGAPSFASAVHLTEVEVQRVRDAADVVDALILFGLLEAGWYSFSQDGDLQVARPGSTTSHKSARAVCDCGYSTPCGQAGIDAHLRKSVAHWLTTLDQERFAEATPGQRRQAADAARRAHLARADLAKSGGAA